MGRHGEAEGELVKAEKMLDEQNTPLGKYRILLVRTNHALAKGNAKKALVYCDSLEKLELEAGGDIELLRGDILTKMGHHAEAAKMFRSLYIGKDSTFTREMRMQLDELNTLYKVDELEMAGKLQRSRFMIGIGILLIIGLLIFTIYRFRASLKLAEEHEKLEQSYKELKIANKKAEESSKMKTNFIQQISHEIRTPLNILSGFTQVITTPGIELDESTKQEANQRITENTNRITGLVNKMLALSDANSQTMIECSDETQALLIAAQAVDASQIAQNQDIDFELLTDSEMDGLMLRTNLQQATQALEMLLDNAQKFIYGKDPSTRQHRGRVTLQVTSNHKNVQFVVEDNGIGIAKRDASRIFEEFVQLDDYYEGTGIGLAISRSIARRMGGDVVLDTSYTAGARFVLRLPLGETNA
jgi:signal transduction histidine kinase